MNINAFNLCNYCIESSIDIELNSILYTYGSAYNPNNSKWYIVGGSYEPITSSPYVPVITLSTTPTINGFSISTYPQPLPQNYSQNEAIIFNNILYSLDGFSDNL